MYQIKIKDTKRNKYVGSYSFNTRADGRKNIKKIAELHYLKKCGYEYLNHELNLEMEVLF